MWTLPASAWDIFCRGFLEWTTKIHRGDVVASRSVLQTHIGRLRLPMPLMLTVRRMFNTKFCSPSLSTCSLFPAIIIVVLHRGPTHPSHATPFAAYFDGACVTVGATSIVDTLLSCGCWNVLCFFFHFFMSSEHDKRTIPADVSR